MDSHKKMKKLVEDGLMPQTVAISMPGYQDVDTDEQVSPLDASVKSSIDSRARLAVEADPKVWLHIIGASKAYEMSATKADADVQKGGYAFWRADKHVVVARKSGKKGKSKIFQVPQGTTEEDKDAIIAKAKDWANGVGDCDDDEQEGECDEEKA